MNLRSRSKVSAEVNMSSMTDLVFLLLVFFIIASTYITPALDIELPSSSSTTPQTQNITMSVKLNKEDKPIYFINGDPIAGDIKSIEKQLKESIKQETGLAKDEKPVVLLRVDKNVKTETTVQMLDIGYRNNLKVILATSPTKNID